MKYDLENRTEKFAKEVKGFVNSLPSSIANLNDVQQLIRALNSVPANYIEANEGLSPKDFYYRIKICRMELVIESYLN